MASMRDIQRRKVSVQSTGQITKAMKLVSTVKLQKAREAAEKSKPYFEAMQQTIKEMLLRTGNIESGYLGAKTEGKKAVIVITSNRGLAGGYNANVTKLLTQDKNFSKENTVIYAIGRKGIELLQKKGYEIYADYSDVIEEIMYKDAMQISNDILEAYTEGSISEIYMAYTSFKNTVTQIPQNIKLLPVDTDDFRTDTDMSQAIMNYEPEEEEALDVIIPKYISSLVYGGLLEAYASENGARMTAMDSATSNAEEMIADLSLKYNRARQGAITQELTEIIAGAEAIS